MKLISLGTIDVRYIMVIAILLVAIWAIRKWPNLALPLTIGLGAAGLAYTVLFH